MLFKFACAIRRFQLAILVSIGLTGCGGGGGSSSSSSTSVGSDEILVGSTQTFTIEGLNYESVSESGLVIRGKTNENGEFNYRSGDIITFSIGDIAFPALRADELVNLLGNLSRILPTNEDHVLEAVSTPTNFGEVDLAINILALLMMLDQDENLDANILLQQDSEEFIRRSTDSTSVTGGDTENSSTVTNIFENDDLLDNPTLNFDLPMGMFIQQPYMQALELRFNTVGEFDYLDLIIFLYEELQIVVQTERIDTVHSYSITEEDLIGELERIEDFFYDNTLAGNISREWINDRNDEPFFDNQGNPTIDIEREFRWQSDAITLKTTTDASQQSIGEEWAYADAKGRLTEYIVNDSISNNPQEQLETFIYNDESNQIIRTLERVIQGPATYRLDETTTYNFDTQGLKIEESTIKFENLDGFGGPTTSSYTQTFEFLNNATETLLTLDNGQNFVERTTFIEGRLASNIFNGVETQYIYDSNNPNQLVEQRQAFGEDQNFVTVRLFSYDQYGNREQCGDQFQYLCQYNEKGQLTAFFVNTDQDACFEQRTYYTHSRNMGPDTILNTSTECLTDESGQLIETTQSYFRKAYNEGDNSPTTLTLRGARYLLKPAQEQSPGTQIPTN